MGNAEEEKDEEWTGEKFENFSEWYNEVIEKAGLSDKRYPVKGMNIWTPYGWKLMQNIDRETRRLVRETGHQEVKFPLLIPDKEFKKEADHIAGFEDEVYWVTKAGQNELDIPLLLRPTSETAMYPVFDLWVRSHADLPLKIYQMVNVFRYETKQTKAFMRMREFHFFEAHTCHATEEGAEEQIEEDLEIMEELSKKICMPYLALVRTDWDKFPGAEYTVGADALMPTGRTLQMAGIHQYKTNFSEAYDITFEDEEGEHKHVHQTTYGMAERLVGAVIGIHGDDKGLILPPEAAPTQVRIIPIIYGDEETIKSYCEDIKAELKKEGIEVDMDDRDERPGSKFYDAEMKGIPVRLDIGSDEVEEDNITLVRRDTGDKQTIDRDELTEKVKSTFKNMQEDMYEKAKRHLEENIEEIDELSEIDEEKIYKFGWCGKESCGKEIEDITGRDLLGTPYHREGFEGECINCGKKTETMIYLSNTH
ncbi:MAG: proline--tRNA ligase [Candidatus Thermoplasmatota archaeon]|nr:proline--tRNA ligase [Candidatus Thermoplasmatota archaeon]